MPTACCTAPMSPEPLVRSIRVRPEAKRDGYPFTIPALATHRFGPDGFYVLDEPEVALPE